MPGKARQLAAEPVQRDLARPPPSHTWRGPGHILPDDGIFAGSDTPEFVSPPSVLYGWEAEPIPAIPGGALPVVILPNGQWVSATTRATSATATMVAVTSLSFPGLR